LFMGYITDQRYDWPEVCLERFGEFPQQIFHEDNSIVHASEYEGRPGRRPLTYDEVQALFDALDTRVDTARTHGIGELVLCSRVRRRVCECPI
jgi:hypothetical protein